MAAHDHPLFTQVYRAVAGASEHTGLARARQEALQQARGRLLIVGLGPGHDLEHLPPTVTEVVAVEPSAPMRSAARHRVEQLRNRGVAVEMVDALGEALPLPDDSVDSVLFAFVLCSVEDVAAVLAEARRVLRPGGTIGVMEHVRADEGTWMHRAQRLVRPVWPRLAGGCHADRNTRAALADAGLDTTELRDTHLANIPPVAPTLLGTVLT